MSLGSTARIIASALSLACAGSAWAETTAYAVGDGSPNSIALPVQVTASVGGHCGFATGSAPSGSVNQGNFDTAGFDRSFTFKLDCTGPSRVGVVSSNGGLLTGGSVPTGYTTKAPYDVQLSLVGNSTNVSSTCGASDLVAGGTSCAPTYVTGGANNNFTGPASTSKGLRLTGAATSGNDSTIRVVALAYAGSAILTNGTYNDTLTITVSAAP